MPCPPLPRTFTACTLSGLMHTSRRPPSRARAAGDQFQAAPRLWPPGAHSRVSGLCEPIHPVPPSPRRLMRDSGAGCTRPPTPQRQSVLCRACSRNSRHAASRHIPGSGREPRQTGPRWHPQRVGAGAGRPGGERDPRVGSLLSRCQQARPPAHWSPSASCRCLPGPPRHPPAGLPAWLRGRSPQTPGPRSQARAGGPGGQWGRPLWGPQTLAPHSCPGCRERVCGKRHRRFCKRPGGSVGAASSLWSSQQHGTRPTRGPPAVTADRARECVREGPFHAGPAAVAPLLGPLSGGDRGLQ